MRPRPIMWFVLCLLCLAGAGYFWNWGNEIEARKRAAAGETNGAGTAASSPAASPSPATQTPAISPSSEAVIPRPGGTNHLDYRLTNTTRTSGQLLRNDRALLLENALLETSARVFLRTPENLRARPDSGTYIVQAANPLDDAFRAMLGAAGAEIVSYIPNNAYLVRMSPTALARVESNPLTHALMDYEPYYKLKWPLLKVAADGTDLPGGTRLNVLLFADSREATKSDIEQLGAKIISEDKSIVLVEPGAATLGQIASLPGVQIVEMHRQRGRANDLARATVGVAENSTDATNNFGLTGAGVIIAVNDTGVDATHPDLTGRVTGDSAASLTDTDGHGTHVAASIAGDGAVSATVTNASGSVMPGVTGQFRGPAPGASIYSVAIATNFPLGPFRSDAYLQESAANTNALISNNSWIYIGEYSYDLAAASYDAAVRDALPETTGSQPVLFVCAAGNDGDGDFSGTGGLPGTVQSPSTAKNVIAVGALEQLRDITNRIVIGQDTNGIAYWEDRTDSDNQVASYSGRGNVGVSIEGEYGRFKPDVVAPGSFVVSARSAQWNESAYYSSTNHDVRISRFEEIEPGVLNPFALFVPQNAVRLTIQVETNVLSPAPLPSIPIYARAGSPPTAGDFVGNNSVSIPPNGTLTTDTTWYFSLGNNSGQTVNLNVVTDIVTTNDLGNYFEVLRQINTNVAPNYRYESGTSMATPVVSGMLALIQEFFESRLNAPPPSPALLKAMLINGAVRINNNYNYALQGPINLQGWGLPSLPNSLLDASNALSQTSSALHLFDQSPSESLATGQTRTRKITVPEDSQGANLRITLVWTDPPGNPVAGVKLVNDLDLVVSNNITGQIYFGNDIIGGVVNEPWETNSTPNIDSVNNVENVYLSAGLDSEYTVHVIGRRVNVNAVTANPNDVAQDYALVISCGDNDNFGPRPIEVVNEPGAIVFLTLPLVDVLTNTFGVAAGSEVSGAMLQGQHVGANTPLLGTTNGMTNQWHFYVMTNTTTYTNAAFVTFLPPNLAIPRMGVFSETPNEDSRVQADIDLYVSLDSGLTNLEPSVINDPQTRKSLRRGGSEFIVYSNAVQNQVYYIGVKSEDQMVAEYSFLGAFSLLPFSEDNGEIVVRGIPVPSVIPDGSNPDPGVAYVLGICTSDKVVRRVVVTNVITHDNLGDLFTKLMHDNAEAVLLNHRGKPDSPVAPGPYNFIFEDNGEDDSINDPSDYERTSSDGPGTLRQFVGESSLGVWLYPVIDDSPGNTGTVDTVNFRIQPQDLEDDSDPRDVQGFSYTVDVIDVPPEATNLTVCISQNTQPVILYLLKDDFSDLNSTNFLFKSLFVRTGGDCLSLSIYDSPPLSAGRYYIVVYNPNSTATPVKIFAYPGISATPATPLVLTSVGDEPILDDAVTYSSIFVPTDARIARTEVGLRVNHPRASDLAITLVSPLGKRILLVENRGRTNTAGFGSTSFTTNTVTAAAQVNNPATITNYVTVTGSSGTLELDYTTFAIGDSIDVYYGTDNFDVPGNIYSSFVQVSVTNEIVIRNFGPGTATNLTIVVNRVANTNAGTSWEYTATVSSANYQYLMLTDNTDDTNRTITPIKFAQFPLVPNVSTILTNVITNVIVTNILTTNLMTTNITVWHSSYELPPYGELAAGTYLGEGWYINSGSVDNFSPAPAGRYEGIYVMDINGNAPGMVVTNIVTIPGGQYTLSFAYTKNWNAASASAEIVVNGSVLATPADSAPNSLANPNWKLDSYSVTAPGNSMQVMVRGLFPSGASGMLFDAFNLELQEEIQEIITNTVYVTNYVYSYVSNYIDDYFFPEESLDVLTGDNAFGEWKLELWDNRVGAYIPGETFVNWGLFFVFERTETEVIPLPPGIIITNTVPPNSILYFSVTVPPDATFATNFLVFADLPVNMLFNQSSLPRGTNAGDFTFLTNATNGSYTLALGGTPTLIPGQTYFLGIQNTNSTNVTVAVAVDFGYDFTGLPPIEILDISVVSNIICVTWSSIPSLSYFVEGLADLGTTNWISVSPTIVATSNETTYCFPMLLPYQFIRVQYGFSPLDTTTTNIAAGSIVDLLIQVPTNATMATNILVSASGPVNMLFNQSNTPTGTNSGDFPFLLNATSGAYTMIIGGTPPLLPGQTYHLGIQNPNATGVTVVVQVSFGYEPVVLTNTPADILGVTVVNGDFCLTWSSVDGQSYFVEGLNDLGTTNWTAVSPTIVATNSQTTYCVPIVQPYQFFRVVSGVSPLPSGTYDFSGIVPVPGGVLLTWIAPTNLQFAIHWTTNLALPVSNWTVFTNVFSSTNGTFTFLDDGSQTGVSGGPIFYHLKQLP